MKKIYTCMIAAAIPALLLATSCQKDERLMYREDPRVYFYGADSLYYTFATQDFNRVKDTVDIVVRIMGDTEDRDRVVKLAPAEGTTAVEGRDYDFGPLVVHAGKYQDTLPLYLYKTEAMKDSAFKLVLKIGDSPDFKPGFTDKNYTQDRQYYKIYFTDQLVKPARWSTSWFGTYSKVKFQFMILATGKTNWDSPPIFPSESNYLAQQVKQALVTYEQKNGPLIDEFGNRVVFP